MLDGLIIPSELRYPTCQQMKDQSSEFLKVIETYFPQSEMSPHALETNQEHLSFIFHG